MSSPMRKHQPTSTLRPPRIQRRPGQSETMHEYLDARDAVDERIDARIAKRRAAFQRRFLS